MARASDKPQARPGTHRASRVRLARDSSRVDGVIAHRRYQWRPSVGDIKSIDVYVGPVSRSQDDWECRLRISGLPRKRDYVKPVYGVDAFQAIELALYAAGKVLSGCPEFRAGQIEWLDQAIRHPAALGLPLPLKSLQSTLEGMHVFLKRRTSRAQQNEWTRGLLLVMEEISLDLATLVAHLPVRPRRRRHI